MTKREALIKIAKRTQHSYDTCEKIIDLFFDSIMDTMIDGGKFVLRGFGTFEPAVSKESRRFDPNSKQIVSFPSSRTVKYRISRSFKEEMNGGKKQ